MARLAAAAVRQLLEAGTAHHGAASAGAVQAAGGSGLRAAVQRWLATCLQAFAGAAEQVADEARRAAAEPGSSSSAPDALGGPTQRPQRYDALWRPLLAAWAAAAAFTPPPAETPSDAAPPAEQQQHAAGQTAHAIAQGPDMLQRGAQALAALQHIHPQLGNLLVRRFDSETFFSPNICSSDILVLSRPSFCCCSAPPRDCQKSVQLELAWHNSCSAPAGHVQQIQMCCSVMDRLASCVRKAATLIETRGI